MNERAEHRDRWDDDLAAYVLDALDEREAALVESHLEGCSVCAERVRWLAPAVDVLPAAVVQRQPPPELRERLMAIVEDEASEAAPVTAPAKAPKSWLERLGLGGGMLRPALAGLAVVLLIATGVTGYALVDGSSTQTYTASATSDGSIASGTLRVNGDEGSLHVTHLPAVREGEVYQAWIQETGDGGATVPSSVFVVNHDGTGEVSIPHGLDGAAQVMITREPAGGSDVPHESPLLVADMS